MSDNGKPLFVSPTVLGDIQRMLGSIDGRTQDLQERMATLPCHSHLQQLATLATKMELVEKAVARDVPDEDVEGRQRRPSEITKAVEERVDKHAALVEDGLTERIHVEALKLARQAVTDELKVRAEAEAQRTKEDVDKTAARVAKFKVYAGAVLAVLVGAGGALGWKSCAVLEHMQTRTEAALRRIETKAAVRPPDAGVEP